jgi:hypothetical protein
VGDEELINDGVVGEEAGAVLMTSHVLSLVQTISLTLIPPRTGLNFENFSGPKSQYTSDRGYSTYVSHPT